MLSRPKPARAPGVAARFADKGVRVAAHLVVAALFLLALFVWGVVIDRRPYSQSGVWTAIQAASLGGVALATSWTLPALDGTLARIALVLVVLVVWRLTYFPLMVFSGHVASVVEWVLALLRLPIVVYGVFLVSIGTLHTLVALGAAQIVDPFHPLVYAAIAGVLLMATSVSLAKPADLKLLPDDFRTLAEPAPPPVAPTRNPYFSCLVGPGYLPHQRVVLLAAGLTYETIPPSPWGRTVKAVLEVLFNERPRASAAQRILDHYLAYRSAHPLIGCRSFADYTTPLPPAPAPPAH
jgi:hypothetical protein